MRMAVPEPVRHHGLQLATARGMLLLTSSCYCLDNFLFGINADGFVVFLHNK